MPQCNMFLLDVTMLLLEALFPIIVLAYSVSGQVSKHVLLSRIAVVLKAELSKVNWPEI